MLTQTREVLERVARIAAEAGLEGRLDEDSERYFLGVSLDGERKQGVLVRDSTSLPEQRIITVFSPCRVLSREAFQGLAGEQAMELLRANESLHFARYGVFESPEEVMVVASVDHLLQTLDPPELHASVFAVALAADHYERRFGKDDY